MQVRILSHRRKEVMQMPFRSERQRRYMFANHPRIARRWADKYGTKPRGKKSKRKK